MNFKSLEDVFVHIVLQNVSFWVHIDDTLMAGAFKSEYIVKNYHLIRKQDVRVIDESSSTIAWDISAQQIRLVIWKALAKHPQIMILTQFPTQDFARSLPAYLFAPLSIAFY